MTPTHEFYLPGYFQGRILIQMANANDELVLNDQVILGLPNDTDAEDSYYHVTVVVRQGHGGNGQLVSIPMVSFARSEFEKEITFYVDIIGQDGNRITVKKKKYYVSTGSMPWPFH